VQASKLNSYNDCNINLYCEDKLKLNDGNNDSNNIIIIFIHSKTIIIYHIQ